MTARAVARAGTGALIAALLFAAPAAAQERGAAAIADALASIGTTGRVLMIAAHPDDEDTNLIAWLARGRHVETAYLALTRGDGGQNLIGNELGESLGAIRTEELLAARRIDGGRQFFTRAYDFGFSKTPEETLEHWPREEVFGDVVRTVRAFRPHVIVSVFSGTPRDGHGHHQLAGRMAREVYDLAADTVRYPVASHGPPWTVAKFYRAARFTPDESTLRINVGEFSPVIGRSYAELAAESRSQHKSQGFGVLQRKGVVWDYVRREASRVNDGIERSIFDGIDTTWAALARGVGDAVATAHLDSATLAVTEARARFRADDPSATVAPLARALAHLRAARRRLGPSPLQLLALNGLRPPLLSGPPDLVDARPAGDRPRLDAAHDDAIRLTIARTERALLLASGLAIEATATRSVVPVMLSGEGDILPDTLGVGVTVYNRGRVPIEWLRARSGPRGAIDSAVLIIAPDSAVRRTLVGRTDRVSTKWWRLAPRVGDLYRSPVDARDDAQRTADDALDARLLVRIAGERLDLRVPVVNRYADPVRGELQRPVAAVPGITVDLDGAASYLRANRPVDRTIAVRVRSAYPAPQRVTLTLALPDGLRADSATRERTLVALGDSTVVFRLRGRLPEGRYPLTVSATYAGATVTVGYVEVAYDHIAPQKLYTGAGMWLQAVDVAVPARTRVAYVQGVGDNGPVALEQLGIPVTRVTADAVGATDFSPYTAVVVGPRAYDAQPALMAQNTSLLDYARRGGTLVVQYGQYEMLQPGVMPFPVTLTRPAARVTLETAPVTLLAPRHPVLTAPNRITADDFIGWVQERGLYMPSTFDARYTPLVATQDPGDVENRGGLLVAPVGRGMYVYTTLALFRQLPQAIPGAARLLVNLISARPSPTPVP
ncbi:MAG: PIG-L family deacetylase [Gemmatimonadaceae bacterium]|nr:PIG-L family deacetylase [Gemmatimonadaceae bacterium]